MNELPMDFLWGKKAKQSLVKCKAVKTPEHTVLHDCSQFALLESKCEYVEATSEDIKVKSMVIIRSLEER